ncbi:thioredoxin family protein [Winogradskyella aurantiaca]|uniref:thioredoxin family protein n=1 Tax=Winogradskyella aurantiaca TaxID=2219558 RepID=UPI000E1D8D29|nr:thioredoxin family protein [Winogradskyella aurantiaca]
METLEHTTIKDIIQDGLANSMSYESYQELMTTLVEQQSTTGNEKTPALANYTMLNERRMKRWDKTVKILEADLRAIQQFNHKVTWLVISESWCGDAAHVIPVLKKVADINPNINLRIVLRDDNPELMDQFLTNGGRSIPKLIILDEAHNVVDTYGPRPSTATEMVMAYKEAHGALTPEFKEDLQRWYNKDKGQTIIADLVKVLS